MVMRAFVLLLTCVASHYLAAQEPLSIPLRLTADKNMVVDARLNGTDVVTLMLHTAAADVTLTEEASQKAQSVKYAGSTKVRAWGGQSEARYSEHNVLQIGALAVRELVVWEDKNSGKGSDGKFGLTTLGKNIIELDLDHSKLVLHEALPNKVDSIAR